MPPPPGSDDFQQYVDADMSSPQYDAAMSLSPLEISSPQESVSPGDGGDDETRRKRTRHNVQEHISQYFELPGGPIPYVPGGRGDHAQITPSLDGRSIKTLAMAVLQHLRVNGPTQIIDPLELGLYQLALRLPSINLLVVRIARDEVSWDECEELKRMYQVSQEYLTAASASAAATTAANIGFQKPQGIHIDEKIASPSGQGNDSQAVSLHEDSGYGSVTERVCLPDPQAKEDAGGTTFDDDAKTTYSRAANEDAVQTRDFVHELASDMYGKLEPMMNPEDWPCLSKSLPQLLKAFSFKIGGDGASQAHRDVMYFIHREHRNIVNQVRSLAFCLLEDADATSRADGDNMSLPDKMDLWGRMLSVDEPKASRDDLFQNVVDDEPMTTLSFMYNKMVLESKHYGWLIQSLKTELSLERCPRDDASIREQIISMLPSATVSRRRWPKYHNVVFRLPTPSIEHLRSDRIVVTSNSHNLQLTRISTYLDKTWPRLGRKVLRMALFLGQGTLKTTLETQSHLNRTSFHLAKKTHALASFRESCSLINLIGPAYSAAEVGEVLAWLSAATLDLPPCNDGHIVLNTPSTITLDDFFEDFLSVKWDLALPSFVSSAGLEPVVGVGIRVGQDKTHRGERPESLWDRLLGYKHGPPVISGYPTTRRPQGCPGLELSYGLLQDARSTGFGHGGHLQESFFRLVLAGRADGVFYWHESHSCACSTERFLKTHGDDIPSEPPEGVLKAARHIICDCELYSETEYEEASFAFGSPSNDSSIAGMLSLASDSENVGNPKNKGPGFYFFKDLLRHLIQDFLSHAPCDGESSTHKSPPLPSGAGSSASYADSLRPIRPRKRLGRGEEESEDGHGDLQPKKRRKGPPSRSLEKPRYLACPFWKLDPDKHWDCFLKQLTTVSFVKQHLTRRHTPALYCQRCFAVFCDEILFDSHITTVSCERGPLSELDGISHIQARKLNQKGKGTVEEQWYAVWDILFPGDPRPLSIYIDSDQSPDFARLREFCQRQGARILHERIRASGRILRADVSEREVTNALREGLDSLFEYYRLSQSPVSAEPSSQTENLTLNDSMQQGGMADNRSTDSGVMLPSYSSHDSHTNGTAVSAIPGNISAATWAAEPASQAQPDTGDSLQALGVFNMDMPVGDWGVLGETGSVFGGTNLDELYDRMFVQDDVVELDTGLSVEI